MADAIGPLLSFAVGVAVSPVPIIAVVLMLATARGRVNGPAFVLGWVLGLAVAGTLVLLVAGGADASEDGEPAAWVGWLKVVLGLLLLGFAVRQWQGRPAAGEEAALPGWMQTIDAFTPGKALGLAVLLAAVNPKNLLLTVGAAAAIAQRGLDAGEQAVALAVFVVLASVGVAAPVLLSLVLGERAGRLLDDLKGWMGAHNAAIMTVLFLVLGAKLLGDGVAAL